ncbi:MAG: glycosyltransferase family 4 protein [Inquilinaceae bacterium]
MTRRLHFALPGDPETRTGGYLYDRRVVDGLRQDGRTVVLHRLADSFPNPDPAALDHARAVFAAIPDGATLVVDGLAFGALPAVAREAADRLTLIALVHHPLADETGLDPDHRRALYDSEKSALAAAAGIVVTSDATARRLADYDVPADRIVVAPPGTDPALLAVGSGGPGLSLLCVASLTRRKGHAVLLDALASLADRAWHLTCAGNTGLDPDTAAAVRARIAETGLDTRVDLLGEVDGDAVAALYHRADLFVLPSYMEGYGMVLTEALARGLPIVATTGGAIPDTVPPAAGILVPPGDAGALSEALGSLMDDRHVLDSLALGARAARRHLETWDGTVGRFAAALRQWETP